MKTDIWKLQNVNTAHAAFFEHKAACRDERELHTRKTKACYTTHTGT